jgi:hypothetical protein
LCEVIFATICCATVDGIRFFGSAPPCHSPRATATSGFMTTAKRRCGTLTAITCERSRAGEAHQASTASARRAKSTA